jgi:hypothetical protein
MKRNSLFESLPGLRAEDRAKKSGDADPAGTPRSSSYEK